MELMTGGCRQAGQGTFVVTRRTMRKKDRMPIAFVCVGMVDPLGAGAGGASDGTAGECSIYEERIRDWFQGQALALCRRGNAAKCVDAAAGSFCALVDGLESGMPAGAGLGHGTSGKDGLESEMSGKAGLSGAAAVFCMGGECFYAWLGAVDICLLNLCFDRPHINKLTTLSEGLVCRRAALEPQVGVLVCNASLLEQFPWRLLGECLEAGALSSPGQLEGRLREISGEARRYGVDRAVAGILVTREAGAGENEAVIRAILERHGYAAPAMIGRGAFGHVYRVTDIRSHRRVACKIAGDMEGRAALRREAQIQRELEHPLFAGFLDLIEEEEISILVMEYVRGKNLGELLAKGPIRPDKAAGMAVQLAEGLRYLHQLPEPVLYRDLKPDNIRVMAGGRVRLLDLGCACKLAGAGKSRAGSRGYAAPEQLGDREEPPGFYSDVYALGRTLAAMLEGNGRQGWQDGMGQFLDRCTDADPARRFSDMDRVLEELRIFIYSGQKG